MTKAQLKAFRIRNLAKARAARKSGKKTSKKRGEKTSKRTGVLGTLRNATVIINP